MFKRTEREVNRPSPQSEFTAGARNQANTNLLTAVRVLVLIPRKTPVVFFLFGAAENSPFKEFKELVVEETKSKGGILTRFSRGNNSKRSLILRRSPGQGVLGSLPASESPDGCGAREQALPNNGVKISIFQPTKELTSLASCHGRLPQQTSVLLRS